MPHITYHKASLADIPTIVEYRLIFLTALTGEQSIEDINQLKEQLIPYLEKSIPEHSIICILAKQGDTVAGIGILQVRTQLGTIKNPSGKWGYIINIYTVPAFRRQGICNHIVNGLTDEAKQLGITHFELHATPEGAPVYEAAGFIKHTEPTYRKHIQL